MTMNLNQEKTRTYSLEDIKAKLTSTDAEARRWSIYELAHFPAGDSIDLLIQSVQDESRAVREAAAEMLENCIPELSIERLTPLLGDPRMEVRNRIAAILAKYGRSAIAALTAALSDSHSDIRKTSADILGMIRDPLAVASLCQRALKDPVKAVSVAAIEALSKIGDPLALDTLYTIVDQNMGLKPEAIEALGLLGTETTTGYLLARIGHEDPITTYAIIDALGNLGHGLALDQIRTYLNTAPEYLREGIVLSIMKIGQRQDEAVLDMGNPFFRNCIIDTLKAGDTEMNALVLHQFALGMAEPDMDMFFQMSTGLPSNIIVGLIHLAKTRTRYWEQITAMIQHVDDWVAYSAVEACERMDADFVGPLLLEVLNRQQGIRLLAALSVIDRLQYKAARSGLENLMTSKHEDIRHEATRILGVWDTQDGSN